MKTSLSIENILKISFFSQNHIYRNSEHVQNVLRAPRPHTHMPVNWDVQVEGQVLRTKASPEHSSVLVPETNIPAHRAGSGRGWGTAACWRVG